MQAMPRYARPLAILVTVATANVSAPWPSATAGMVATEAVIGAQQDSRSDRARLRAFLQRAEIRARFTAYGIDPQEALARVDSLTDREVSQLAGKLDQLPAGGQGNSGGEEYYSVGGDAGALMFALIAVPIIIFLAAKGISELIDGIPGLIDETSKLIEEAME